ncbi:MAG: hypothetical protein ABIJ81_01735 [Patescibacteria group bacterium]
MNDSILVVSILLYAVGVFAKHKSTTNVELSKKLTSAGLFLLANITIYAVWILSPLPTPLQEGSIIMNILDFLLILPAIIGAFCFFVYLYEIIKYKEKEYEHYITISILFLLISWLYPTLRIFIAKL